MIEQQMTPDAKPETVLNCPFCARVPAIVKSNMRNKEYVSVQCDCDCMMHEDGGQQWRYEKDAIATWNRRATEPKPCVWTCDEEGNWDTGCGKIFVLIDADPFENKMQYCCYCGGRLEQSK